MLWGETDLARFRLFEIVFTSTFAIYMCRNLLDASEWLTNAGFHLSADSIHPSRIPPLPLLPSWAVPFYASGILMALITVWFAPKWRRLWFVCLIALAWYAEGVDSASAFALNKLYIVGFFLLAISPGYEAAYRGPVINTWAFQAMLLTLYFVTGLAKVYGGGDWLEHHDVVWTHAQGYYRTTIAAWLLRHLPMSGWTVIQFAVLSFELGAPLLFSWSKTRPMAIAFGLLFHLGIAVLMKAVWVFSMQMAAFYVLFLRENTARRIINLATEIRHLFLKREPDKLSVVFP